jgi:hypothetical protein
MRNSCFLSRYASGANFFSYRPRAEPRPPPRIISGRGSTARGGKVLCPWNCVPRQAWRGCCAMREDALTRRQSCRRYTTDSPRASTRPT